MPIACSLARYFVPCFDVCKLMRGRAGVYSKNNSRNSAFKSPPHVNINDVQIHFLAARCGSIALMQLCALNVWQAAAAHFTLILA